MLKDAASSAILAVRDLAVARAFYTDTLDLPVADGGGDGVLVLRTGTTKLVLYVSDYAGTNQANAAVWGVGDDFGNVMADLAGKGVAFEHYPDRDGFRRHGDHYVAGDFRMAWFRDPDGNILHINSGD